MELRPYQREAVAAIRDDWREHDKTYIVLPTGTGKTIVVSYVIREVLDDESPARVLILAHRDELLTQAHDKLLTAVGIESVYEKASLHIRPEAPNDVVISSVQTLQNSRLARLPEDYFDYIIVDECHHVLSDSYQAIMAHFPKARVLGVTATPDRGDRKDIGDFFDNCAYTYTLPQAIRDGWLSRIVVKKLDIAIDLTKVHVRQGDYVAGEVGSAIEPYLEKIAERMVTECAGRHTVVFTPLIHTSQVFERILNSYGFKAVEVNGNTKNRSEILRDFEKGKYNVLVNSMLLCLDEDTEILTQRGFLRHDELTMDDLVANWNFDGSVFFEKPQEIVHRPLGLDEHMTAVESRTVNFRVTDSHRMIVRKGAGALSWKKISAGELRQGHMLPAFGLAEPLEVEMPEPKWERLTHRRVESGELFYTKPSELSLDDCRFIGFFLAEGTKASLQSGGVEYKVSQVYDIYPAITKWFDKVISGTGFDVVRKVRYQRSIDRNVVHWSFSRGTGHSSQSRNGLFRIEPYLRREGTELFWGLNEEQFDALIEGFWYGDGNHGSAENGMPKSVILSGVYHELFDLFCAIGSVRGWRCHLSKIETKNPKHSTQWRILLIKGRNLYLSYKTPITQESYRPENVWCVRTTSRNIITRRNGYVTVMGNTEGWDCPCVDCIVMLRPTKVRALYVQAVGRGTRLYPGKRDLKLLDFLYLSEKHDLCKPSCLLGDENIAGELDRLFDSGAETDLLDGERDVRSAIEEREKSVIAQLHINTDQSLNTDQHIQTEVSKKKLVDWWAVSSCLPGDAFRAFRPSTAQLQEPVDAYLAAQLEEMGIRPTSVDCRARGELIANTVSTRALESLATPKQLSLLNSYSYRGIERWTKWEASKVIGILAGHNWRATAEIDPHTYDPRKNTLDYGKGW